MFEEYLQRWNLIRDGDSIVTPSSQLMPALMGGVPVMLKIATATEEKNGSKIMLWWAGNGAAKVIAHSGNAILLERAETSPTLPDLVKHGRDAEASEIICAVVTELHRPRVTPQPNVVPLSRWFQQLEPGAASHGGVLVAAATAAIFLLTRDMASMSALFVLLFPTSVYAENYNPKVAAVYAGGLLLQYFLIAISARNYGNRFVLNVLVEESQA